MLDERLLQILVCPGCRASLEYKERRKVLICTECGTRYEVREGIPIMLAPEARGAGAAPVTERPTASAD
jgi:uncharacterized protein YbaR (Trm112 family)